jgi:hypothetical protein
LDESSIDPDDSYHGSTPFLQKCLAPALLLAFLASTAQAAHRIEQEVQAGFDGKTYGSKHVWIVDDGKFRLTVATPRGEAIYLFNGRNFYVCGKLDADDKAFLAKNQLKGDQLVARFKSGACQAVPSNFMARFFLAQSLAAESLDRADGMEVTLAVDGYQLKATGRKEQTAGKSCDGYERAYTVKKKTEDGGIYAVSAEEKLCVAPAPDWRAGLWTEVAKSILRQPGGAALMGQLKKDRDGVQGFPMKLESQYKLAMPDGKAHTGKVKAVVTAVKSVEADATTFKLPSGFQMFAPESEDIPELAANAGGGAPKKKASEEEAESAAEKFLQSAQSVFLCAISSSLGCTMAE